MKDYEKVQELEKELFTITEDIAFHKATLNAFDASIKEKKATYEVMLSDYNDKVARFQIALTSMEKRKAEITRQLEGAIKTQHDNVVLKESVGKEQCPHCAKWYKDLSRHKCKLEPKPTDTEEIKLSKKEKRRLELEKQQAELMRELEELSEEENGE